jgi:hypothetical protein
VVRKRPSGSTAVVGCTAERLCATLRWHLTRVLSSSSRDKRGAQRAVIGLGEVGYSEQMMVAPANVVPGLAACACADRPASFSEIFHRRTGPRHGTTPLSALAASRGHRVRAPETAAQKRRISRPAAALCPPALAIALYLMQAMRPSRLAVRSWGVPSGQRCGERLRREDAEMSLEVGGGRERVTGSRTFIGTWLGIEGSSASHVNLSRTLAMVPSHRRPVFDASLCQRLPPCASLCFEPL